jgi:tRNA1Val (adenine37-N6)-methyltransferase
VGFYLIHQTDFKGYDHNTAKVSALTLARSKADFKERLLTIYESHGVYSKDSEAYLTDFMLRFSKKTVQILNKI